MTFNKSSTHTLMDRYHESRMDSSLEFQVTKSGFIECKRIVLELLLSERKKFQTQRDEAVRRGDGVTANKLIGRIEQLQDLERKIFALEASEPSSH